MTITQALTYVKSMFNESSAITPNWSDSELYQLFENRSNMVLNHVGLVEATDTSNISVAGTQTISFPTNFIKIRRVWYSGVPLKLIGFREFESRMPTGVAPSGTPREMLIWQQQIKMMPIPINSGDVITIYGEKQQSVISGAASTLDCPSVFHPALCDGVLSDMFAKDLQGTFFQFYNNRWEKSHVPLMEKFAKRRNRRGLPSRVIDADSVLETELGIA